MRQLRLDNLGKGLKGLGAKQILAVNVEHGLAPNTGLAANLILALDQAEIPLLIQAGIETLGVQAGFSGQLLDRLPDIPTPERILVLKEHIVKVPETALFAGTFRGLMSLIRAIPVTEHRVKNQPDLAGGDVGGFELRFSTQHVGTAAWSHKVGIIDDGHRRIRVAQEHQSLVGTPHRGQPVRLGGWSGSRLGREWVGWNQAWLGRRRIERFNNGHLGRRR